MRIPRIGFPEPITPIHASQVAQLGVAPSIVAELMRLAKEVQPWKA